MFKTQNFCHIASNNRNQVKAGVFVYRTTDSLNTVSASGYFNERIIDINLHDLILHEKTDAADATKVERNWLCVTERTLDNVKTTVIKSKWEGDIEQYIEDTFVKKDGSSIMTGPLKFRAGSFEGAIAGGLGDGISVYKMNADGSINSEVAALTKTNGFIPGTTNAMNIGSSSLKWKDAYIARVITAVLNNGANISVPAKAGTMALMSDVELAANSGTQLWTTGVWYAKMYSGTVAPAADNGTNYADFSQVDGSGNPIIVIYTRTAGAWVETSRITPPAQYNGYLWITSKIWDIAEQSGQQGGQVLWSYSAKTFTPYPRIISFDSIEVTGNSTVIMPVNPDNNQIVNKAYVDDVANPLKYSTDCITEIPQDIKLELNAGTLTLKAGSKVYVPNGSGVFDIVPIDSDLTIPAWGNIAQGMLSIKPSGSGVWISLMNGQYSGGTVPTSSQYELWYDTTNNYVKTSTNTGSTWDDGWSLPIALITSNGSSWTSIDQVFNGFGYIGSTAFALPGVKCLVSNGRNSDGSLKNLAVTISSVQIITNDSALTTDLLYAINTNGTISNSLDNYWTYNPEKNYWMHDNAIFSAYFFAKSKVTAGVISDWNAKTVFYAVDYGDMSATLANLLQTLYPIGSLYIGTQNTCPMATLIPNSTWSLVSSGKALWTGDGTNGNTTIAAGLPNLTGTFHGNAITMYGSPKGHITETTGVFSAVSGANSNTDGGDGGANTYGTVTFDASQSGTDSIYGKSSTVQPPAYVVNVWRRTA